MKFSGHTRTYAVLGHPIGHTLSPHMHNASFRTLGLDAVYLAFDVAPDRLMAILPALRDLGFGGVNLTVPLKEVAYRGLSLLDDSAARLGAVNTVEFLPDGQIRGHNTDGQGFLVAIREAFGVEPANRNIFVFGCGGAGRAVAITCAVAGASRLWLTDVDPARTQRVAAEIAALAPSVQVEPVPAISARQEQACRAAELVVQATPIGMKPTDPPPLPPAAFHSGQNAYDLVYMYPQTVFMQAAAAGGAKTSNGLGMLLHQGACAFNIWTGKHASIEAMRQALQDAVYGGK